jgi:hypothetical protein
MNIKRVEFRELCSHAEPKLATTVLLAETHEWKLEGDWLHWRTKQEVQAANGKTAVHYGEWHASPLSMVRNVTLQSVDTSETSADGVESTPTVPESTPVKKPKPRPRPY